MKSFNGASRVKDIRRDVAPSTPAIMYAFGFRDGTVTYSVKDEGALSNASWNTILVDERAKVAVGTVVVMSSKCKEVEAGPSTLIGVYLYKLLSYQM